MQWPFVWVVLLTIGNEHCSAVMLVPGSLSLYQYHPKPLPSCLPLLSSAHQPKFWHVYREQRVFLCAFVRLWQTAHLLFGCLLQWEKCGAMFQQHHGNIFVWMRNSILRGHFEEATLCSHFLRQCHVASSLISSLSVTEWVQHQDKCLECYHETEAWLKCLCIKCVMQACLKQMLGQV